MNEINAKADFDDVVRREMLIQPGSKILVGEITDDPLMLQPGLDRTRGQSILSECVLILLIDDIVLSIRDIPVSRVAKGGDIAGQMVQHRFFAFFSLGHGIYRF